MSTQSPFGGRIGRAFPTLPKGETVASYETYQEAQAAVDRLAKAEFPVKELSIVGHDLTSVERITGTLSWGRAAGAGALSGAWFGTFLGLLLFIFSPSGTSLGILGAAILIGAGFGMIFSVVSYSINRRRRDFTSVMQVLATRYAVIAEPAHVIRARQVLGVADAAAPPSPGAAPVVTPPPAEPVAEPGAQPGAAEPDGVEDSTSPAPVGDGGAPEPRPTDDSRPLTYGEAQDAARRAARERREADGA
ncbi:general stress protein [Agromyces sp. NPDC056523]|uniref:general stress protein n=1 Tax=Agromyces sp. NPDC056523 TaxID=3345850 RepID=UPI00366D0ED8